MANETSEVVKNLVAVKEVLRGGWAIDFFALDGAGNKTSILSPTAKKFCIGGAIAKVHGFEDGGKSRNVPEWGALTETLNGDSVANFNNNQKSVEPVLELIDKTIIRLEDEASLG